MTTALTFQLPIPDRALSPNSRGHWAVKSKAVKAARLAGYIEAKRVLDRHVPPLWRKAKWCAVLMHKGKRTPDPDNFIASLKSYLDGITDAGVMSNDRDLWPERPVFVLVDRMPRVEITITPE